MLSNRHSLIEKARQQFQSRFGATPDWVSFAPGRINLIGEHTDYHEGLALPAAISRGVAIAIGMSSSRNCQIWSESENELLEFTPNTQLPTSLPTWHRYIRGADAIFREHFPFDSNWRASIVSDLPAGAGVSASAALELALLHGLASLKGITWEPALVVKAAQQIEHRFLQLGSGLLDQIGSQYGQENAFLWLDFRDFRPGYLNGLPQEWTLLVADSGTRRSLAAGGIYQQRVRESGLAFEKLAAYFPVEIDHPRDVLPEHITALRDPVMERRVRHYVSEIERVEAAADCLQSGYIHDLGALINACHDSLRDDYEVSWPAGDQLVETARSHPACAGARMMGGGLGGVILALVETGELDGFARHLEQRYYQPKGLQIQPLVVKPAEGPFVTRG